MKTRLFLPLGFLGAVMVCGFVVDSTAATQTPPCRGAECATEGAAVIETGLGQAEVVARRGRGRGRDDGPGHDWYEDRDAGRDYDDDDDGDAWDDDDDDCDDDPDDDDE